MQRQAKQQKVHFLIHFGEHETANDFAKAKAAADSFKPHLYAMEDSGLTKQKRSAICSQFNRNMAKARGNPAIRKMLLDDFERKNKPDTHSFGFARAQFLFPIDSTYKLIVFPLEAHDAPLPITRDSITKPHGESMRSASHGNIQLAIAQMSEAIRLQAERTTIRDNSIVENIGSYSADASTAFPKLMEADPLRIFATLGAGHINVFAKATELYAGNPNLLIAKREGISIQDPYNHAVQSSMAGENISEELLLRAIVHRVVLLKNYAEQRITGQNGPLWVNDPVAVFVSYKLTTSQINELLAGNATMQDSDKALSQWVLKVGIEAEKLAHANG
jgi:hypothetical protein